MILNSNQEQRCNTKTCGLVMTITQLKINNFFKDNCDYGYY